MYARPLLSTIFMIVFLAFMSTPAGADSVTHDWPGTESDANNTFDVDDEGGSFNNGGNDDTYHLVVNGIDVTASITLILFDGQSVDDGVDDHDLGDNNATDTGEDFSMGSGLQILEPPPLFNPPITEIGAASGSPLTPITFFGNETGLDVEMFSYVQDGTDFAILEYVVRNNTANTVPVKIGLVGDYDVDSNPNINGKDLSVPVVYEYRDTINGATNLYYAAGLALAGGTLDNYRLGACCDLSFEGGGNGFPAIRDIQRKHYFNARPNEECDDGDNDNGDGCSANCLIETGSEVCGNGVVEPGEGCDDNNMDNNDGCDSNCLSEDCGDGVLDPGEECDDGALLDGDGCSSFCTVEYEDAPHFCGDTEENNGGVGDQVTDEQDVEVTISADLGMMAPGESQAAAFCVVGGTSDVDGPNAGAQVVLNSLDCLTLYQQTIAVCGNGFQNAGEACDDGNLVDDDGCDSNCTPSGCGNNIVNANEGCDDGNTVDGDGCNSACNLEASCGDGVQDAGEACDDGNNISGDGCSSTCTTESGGGCSLHQGPENYPWMVFVALMGLMVLGMYRTQLREDTKKPAGT